MRTIVKFKPCLFVLCGAFIFFSCSKEEPLLETELSTAKFEPFFEVVKETNDLNKNAEQVCVEGVGEVHLESAEAGVSTGGGKYKTMFTHVYQDFNSIRIEAVYNIDANLENLPARITLSLGSEEFIVDQVNPGETVSHTFDLPENWIPGDQINYQIDQKVYLSPISVIGSLQLMPHCPIEVGEEILGGIVAYSFQSEEGKSHGLVLLHEAYPSPTFTGNWYDAIEWANNLEINGYSDWTIPTIEELEILMPNYYGYFPHDPVYDYGYWSTTNDELNDSKAYGGTMTGDFIGTPQFSSRSFYKTNSNVFARAVRHF